MNQIKISRNIFKLCYKKDLFKDSGIELQLKHPSLEADDIIAITKNYIRKTYPDAYIWIITSDMDYLQLAEQDKVMLFDMNFKELTKKYSFNDPEKDLFYKIVMGDKSDNIPPIFPKCGIKTADKLYNDKNELLKKIKENQKIKKQFDFNEKIIDFKNIPQEYIDEFSKELLF